MDDYRSLTEEEIEQLERQGCSAEDWTAISVSEEFCAEHLQHVRFYGNVELGVFDKNIEVDEGFVKHSGIYNATLKDVTIGDNTLIENVGNYICNYEIGEECYIANIGKMNTTSGATFGEGNVISVLNEGGTGNIIVSSALTSQLAALILHNKGSQNFTEAINAILRQYISGIIPEHGQIGYRVKIVNTTEITNAIINDDCEISGASRLSECSILSNPDASCFIGNDVILDNAIVQAGSSILDGAKVDNCFIGEACHIGKGASTEATLFFANSYIDNGETCASFCGPFTVSHHKSSLLIGGEYSFYNAGSNTNFSNHAYKMGPIHWGTMARGSKTASGAHILWPATIGTFSMCMGKIQTHPKVSDLPFSYLFGNNDGTYLVPGINLTTVGTYRDTAKWAKRDMRPRNGRLSLINYDWLSPLVISECMKGKKTLERLRKEMGENAASYNYNGVIIRNQSLLRGIKYYDMAIHLAIGRNVKNHKLVLPYSSIGSGDWTDLGGLLVPQSEESQLVADIVNGDITDTETIQERFLDMFNNYDEYRWTWTYRAIMDYHNLETIDDQDADEILEKYEEIKKEWKNAISYDAEKEFKMGDVDEKTLNNFIEKI